MLENPDFKQEPYSRTAEGINKIGHDTIILKKTSALHYRSYYENVNFYDLMGSFEKYSNEIF